MRLVLFELELACSTIFWDLTMFPTKFFTFWSHWFVINCTKRTAQLSTTCEPCSTTRGTTPQLSTTCEPGNYAPYPLTHCFPSIYHTECPVNCILFPHPHPHTWLTELQLVTNRRKNSLDWPWWFRIVCICPLPLNPFLLITKRTEFEL